MFPAALFSFIIFSFPLVKGSKRSDGLRIPTVGHSVPIRFEYQANGPRTAFQFRINYHLAETVVIDEFCGRHSTNCPKYCCDGENWLLFTGLAALVELYCDPRCVELSNQSIVLHCSDSPAFKYKKTESAQKLNIEWHRDLPGNRPLFGEMWSDELSIRYTRYEPKAEWHHVEVLIPIRLRFVSATLFDSRLTNRMDAIFGVAPGPNSTFQQYRKAYGLKKPLACISKARSVDTIRRHRTPGLEMLTIGELDRVRCSNDWFFIPSLSKSTWAIESQFVEFFGTRIDESIIISFVSDVQYVIIPEPIADYLNRTGLLPYRFKVHKTLTLYAYAPKAGEECFQRGVRFGFGGETVEMKASMNRGEDVEDGKRRCHVYVSSDEANPHTRRNVIIIGTQLFEENCLGFDYERLMVGFARQRPKPAHPLLPDVLR